MTTVENCVDCGNNSNKFMSFLLLVILTGLTLFLVGSFDKSHAIAKHANDAVITRNCIDNNGADFVYNKTDDRKVQLCFIDLDGNGTFDGLGIRVLEKMQGKWEELTSFINREIKTVEDAIGFMDMDMGKYGYVSFVKDIWKIFIH